MTKNKDDNIWNDLALPLSMLSDIFNKHDLPPPEFKVSRRLNDRMIVDQRPEYNAPSADMRRGLVTYCGIEFSDGDSDFEHVGEIRGLGRIYKRRRK